MSEVRLWVEGFRWIGFRKQSKSLGHDISGGATVTSVMVGSGKLKVASISIQASLQRRYEEEKNTEL